MVDYYIIPCPNDTISAMGDGPFTKLQKLIDDITPNTPFGGVVNLHLGEPDGQIPEFAQKILQKPHIGWSKYPVTNGSDAFRAVVAEWANNRYELGGWVKPDNILPLSGTREGLFSLGAYHVMLKKRQLPAGHTPITIFNNPFYHVYKGCAYLTNSDICIINGKLSDILPTLPVDILQRTAQVIICAPDNPTGAIPTDDEFTKILQLAQQYKFMVLADECYSELYYGQNAPRLSLPIAQQLGCLENLAMVNSLSKRSGAPGLRSGIVITHSTHIKNITQLRSHLACIPPAPIIDVSTALWADNDHVVINRTKYNERVNIACDVFGNKLLRPDGGLFLYLNVNGGEAMCRKIYQHLGVKTLPGRYMAIPNPADNTTNADNYLRIAMLKHGDEWRNILTQINQLWSQT